MGQSRPKRAFRRYREERKWYSLCDIFLTAILSLILGLISVDCEVLAKASTVVQSVDFVILLALMPHHTQRAFLEDLVVYVGKVFVAARTLSPPYSPLRPMADIFAGLITAGRQYVEMCYMDCVCHTQTVRRV